MFWSTQGKWILTDNAIKMLLRGDRFYERFGVGGRFEHGEGGTLLGTHLRSFLFSELLGLIDEFCSAVYLFTYFTFIFDLQKRFDESFAREKFFQR